MEIGTLSFKEYLNFNGVDISDNIGFSPDRFEVIRLFDKYFAEGGFPELLKFNEKKEYLSSIFQKVFLGDIIARYQLRNPQALRLLIKKLAESTMDEVSYSRMRNIIVSAGFPVGTNTVIEYINFLENSFLINTLLNSNAKISIRESKKKYYFRDNGILSLFLIEPASFQLETLVFNHLRLNYGSNLFYFRNGFEVDFFVPGEELIQVCYSLEEPATRKREISSLHKVYDKNPVKRLTIVTYSTEEIINENGMEIKVMPAWRWLLES
jgi:predicted AAA+ superfamily ATPase